MEVSEHRKWMDNSVDCDKNITAEFKLGIYEYVKFALEQDEDNIAKGKIRCPCTKCKCVPHETPDTVKVHLCQRGFMSDYYRWTNHGEPSPPIPPVVVDQSYYGRSGQREMFDNYEQLVMDAAGPVIGNHLEQEDHDEEDTMTEDPNPEAQQFFEMLKAAQSPLWNGYDKHSVLSASLTALSLKTKYNLSEVNGRMQLLGDVMPDGNKMPKNLYQGKKSISELGLGSVKIDCCPEGCMLYYKEYEMLQNCKFCGEERYRRVMRQGKVKLVPLKSMWYFPLVRRLCRLYFSIQKAHEMRWHCENQREAGSLSHPSDAKAWKHFDEAWPVCRYLVP